MKVRVAEYMYVKGYRVHFLRREGDSWHGSRKLEAYVRLVVFNRDPLRGGY